MIHWFFMFFRSASSTISDNRPPIYLHILIHEMMGTYCLICISNSFSYMCNPKEILGTSKFHHPLFWQKHIDHIINFLFYCLWKYIHNDVFNHQTTRQKTLGIVISHVLVFDWKNTIFRAKFFYLKETIIHCQKLETLTFPPFVCYNKHIFFK